MEAEIRRFNDVSSKLTSPAILRIRSRFQSFKALADYGILVCRDVSEGLYPSTLEEVFAVASVSHAISRLLVYQKRMEEAQVLSGVRRWRDCIDKVDERRVFDTLASAMWPSSCVSFTKPGQLTTNPQSQTTPPTEALDNASHILQTIIPVFGIDRLSGDALHAGDTRIPPASLQEGVLDITDRTAKRFGFSQLCHDNGGDSYVPPKDTDPRELSRFCRPDQHIPDYNPSTSHLPPLEARLPTPTPPIPSCESSSPQPFSASSPRDDHRLYHFPITEEVFDCKAINLRNTTTFLAVLTFASNYGDGLYLLSGSGMTAAHSGIGSVRANERSKTEKRLRKEFFDPLKKAGTEDAGFLALLAVAKEFVVRGSLRTKAEVEDYLIAISKVR